MYFFNSVLPPLLPDAYELFLCVCVFVRVQDNGGRKPRKILMDNTGDNMDLDKVVEWVSHCRLENAHQNNDPTGQAKLRKVHKT